MLFNPPVNIMGPGSRAPALCAALHDFALKLSALFL
jgi:hypothetical protein